MAKQSSKWEMKIVHHPNEVEIVFNGPSKGANDLLAIEALLRGLKSFDTDIDFKDGKAPKKITKRWFLPLSKIKAKLNPGPKSKKKAKHEVPDEAVELYRKFNNAEPDEIIIKKVWLPDANSPLVALGEGSVRLLDILQLKPQRKAI